MNTSKNPESTRPGPRLAAAVTLGCLLTALAACGQRGPLYLPDDPPGGPATQQESESGDEENDEETPGT